MFGTANVRIFSAIPKIFCGRCDKKPLQAQNPRIIATFVDTQIDK
jgi:hypothetical protein